MSDVAAMVSDQGVALDQSEQNVKTADVLVDDGVEQIGIVPSQSLSFFFFDLISLCLTKDSLCFLFLVLPFLLLIILLSPRPRITNGQRGRRLRLLFALS